MLTFNTKFENYCSNVTYETSYSTIIFTDYQKTNITYLLRPYNF